MVYSVKEIFLTLQGEGYHSGKTAVFLRFAGCNLWTGLEKDRKNAICQFCDTDFIGIDGVNGGKFKTALDLADLIDKIWQEGTYQDNHKYIVITGGEPLLQCDTDLIDALHDRNFKIAIETNGTIIPPDGIDWICMSPKADSDIKVFKGNEIKFIYPQEGFSPEIFTGLNFEHFYIQPKDDINHKDNIKKSVEYCHKHPLWKLSLQTHKLINIP